MILTILVQKEQNSEIRKDKSKSELLLYNSSETTTNRRQAGRLVWSKNSLIAVTKRYP